MGSQSLDQPCIPPQAGAAPHISIMMMAGDVWVYHDIVGRGGEHRVEEASKPGAPRTGRGGTTAAALSK